MPGKRILLKGCSRSFFVAHGGTTEMPTIWDEIEKDCLQILSLPHNVVALKKDGKTPQAEAKKKVAEVRSGLGGAVRREEFRGPKLFLRVVGRTNRAYSGEWWFDADLLSRLEAAYSRIYFQSADRQRAIGTCCASYSRCLPSGTRSPRFGRSRSRPERRSRPMWARARRKSSSPTLPLSAEGNRMLVGRAEQVFFPVKNPLWVKQYSQLHS